MGKLNFIWIPMEERILRLYTFTGLFLIPPCGKVQKRKKKFLTIMATSNFHIGSNLVFHSIPTFWWWWVEKKSKCSFRIAQWGQKMFKLDLIYRNIFCTHQFLGWPDFLVLGRSKKRHKFHPLNLLWMKNKKFWVCCLVQQLSDKRLLECKLSIFDVMKKN